MFFQKYPEDKLKTAVMNGLEAAYLQSKLVNDMGHESNDEPKISILPTGFELCFYLWLTRWYQGKTIWQVPKLYIGYT